MKKSTKTTELETNIIAADTVVQGTTGAGGKCSDFREGRPCNVYLVTLKGTSKAYLGITTRPVEERWREHRKHARADLNYHFHNGLRKYGLEAFDWEWIGTLECWQDGCDFERKCISLGLTHYNMAPGGEGFNPWFAMSEEQREQVLFDRSNKIVTRETRQKMSEAKKGKPSPHKGKSMSDETRQKMSESATGRKASDEVKQKLSLASKGREVSIETREKISQTLMGHEVSEETRLKMSCSRKGTEPWNKGKQVMTDEQKEHLRQVNLGKTLSPETIAKIVKANTGQQRESPSQEVRDRISATLMGNVPWNKGKELSQEHCKNLSLSHMGKKQSAEVIAKRTASRLATLARKKEEKLLKEAMGPVTKEVILDG